MINISKLTKKFISGSTTVVAVNDVTMAIPEGSMAAIIGKSGSGKSTLLALLGALDTPTSGTITVGDHEVTKLRGRKLLDYRRKTIGFVFQSYNLIPNLSALENVMLPMEFAGRSSQARRQRAEHLLQAVGLTDKNFHRPPNKLSGGEQQRVAIARALANQPQLVLADEPTGNLDTQTGKTVVTLLRQLAQSEKTTVITVTHDQGIAQQADHVFKLVDGTIAK